MSLFQMKKRCSKCHRKYSFNPDVGQIACPYCGNLNAGGKILNGINENRIKKDRKKQ